MKPIENELRKLEFSTRETKKEFHSCTRCHYLQLMKRGEEMLRCGDKMEFFPCENPLSNDTCVDFLFIEEEKEIELVGVVRTSSSNTGGIVVIGENLDESDKTLDDLYTSAPPKLTHIESEFEFPSLDNSESTDLSLGKTQHGFIKNTYYRVSSSSSFAEVIKLPDMDDYMNRRTMTPLQERMNGFTMLLGALYGFYYCSSGVWLWDNDQVDIPAFTLASDLQCGKLFPWVIKDLHAMPPLPMVFIAIGLAAHAPISFVYHWHYCTTLPPGKPRFDHWSRKLDQAFIHVASAFVSYGTSGRWDYFTLNVVYNAYCAWCTLSSPTATPLKTQSRILLSLFLYTFPFIQHDEFDAFFLSWVIIGFAIWLFFTYPIGGWSHAAFHLVLALHVPILLEAASQLPVSQQQIRNAAKCAASLRKFQY